MTKCVMIFDIDGKKKTFTINEFPTIGQLLDIENMKTTLSGGRYNDMVKVQITSMTFALDLIDALSCFLILNNEGFNNIFKDLMPKGSTIMDIPASKSKTIVDQYRKKFFPWYKTFMAEIYSSTIDTEDSDFDVDTIVEEKN